MLWTERRASVSVTKKQYPHVQLRYTEGPSNHTVPVFTEADIRLWWHLFIKNQMAPWHTLLACEKLTLDLDDSTCASASGLSLTATLCPPSSLTVCHPHGAGIQPRETCGQMNGIPPSVCTWHQPWYLALCLISLMAVPVNVRNTKILPTKFF